MITDAEKTDRIRSRYSELLSAQSDIEQAIDAYHRAAGHAGLNPKRRDLALAECYDYARGAWGSLSNAVGE